LPETDSSQSLSDEDSESVPFPSVDLEQQQSGSDLLPPVDAMPLVQHHPSSSDLPPLVDSHQIVQDTSSSSSASTDTFSEPEEEEGPHVPFHNHTSGKMVEELTTEKEQLLAELAVAKQLLSNERKKCRALEKKVVVLKEKEKQEAQALAAMVQKAEANLKLTTNRAVTAESKVTQLRKEVLVLQTKLAKQQSSSVNQHYEALLETVREKASQGSQQITQSADRAESMLKLVSIMLKHTHFSHVMGCFNKVSTGISPQREWDWIDPIVCNCCVELWFAGAELLESFSFAS
jgi:hypothetical protein